MATEWSLNEEIRLIRERVKVLNQIPKACKQLSERFRELKKTVQFNQGQCSYLCDSFSVVLDELSWSIQKEFSNIHQKAIELQRKTTRQCADFDHCLSLCRDSFLELNHAIHDGQELITACTSEHWCRSAIIMSTSTDSLDSGPRQFLRSPFGICLRRFLWSLDVVENAFMVLTRNPNFRYRERLNLYFVDNGSNNSNGLTLEGLTDLLMGNKAMDLNIINTLVSNALYFRELSDRKAMTKKLDDIVNDSFRHDFEFTQHQAIADFLLKKLNGASPQLDSLPDSYWLDHKDLVCVRHLGHGDHSVTDEYEWFGFSVAVKSISGVQKDFIAKKAAILAVVKHPHVVQLIGCAYREEDQTGMLILELMDQDLQSLLCSRSSVEAPFNLVVAIDIMLQVAKAMEYLHDCQIVHGDLGSANLLMKPSNFPGREKFLVKVTNYGQMKYQFVGRRFKESIRWRAPEVTGKEADEGEGFTRSVDVYSFGLVCYEILTAKLPFEGTPLATLPERVKAGERPELPSYCPDYLAECIQQCWASVPEDRPTFGEICMRMAYYKKLILMRSTRKHWYPSDFIELEKIIISKSGRLAFDSENGSGDRVALL
ncbi:hypothetical protein M758_2G151600 [Ceratodon purpureus]|nr:hypothetical protein M758_2G151600 [Ceratodon purpureus]